MVLQLLFLNSVNLPLRSLFLLMRQFFSGFYPSNVVAKALSCRHPSALNLLFFLFLFLRTETQTSLVLLSYCITFFPPDQHEAPPHPQLLTFTIFFLFI